MVAAALAAVDGVGPVDVFREITSVTSGAASWVYTVGFTSIVGDVDQLVVGSGEKKIVTGSMVGKHELHGFLGVVMRPVVSAEQCTLLLLSGTMVETIRPHRGRQVASTA